MNCDTMISHEMKLIWFHYIAVWELIAYKSHSDMFYLIHLEFYKLENLTWLFRVMGWAYFRISNGSCLKTDIREITYKKGLKLKLKMRHILQSLKTSIQCIWLAVFGKLLYYEELKGSNSYIQWTLIIGFQIPVLLLF